MDHVTLVLAACAVLSFFMMLVVTAIAADEYKNGARHLMVGPATSWSFFATIMLIVNAFMFAQGLSNALEIVKQICLFGLAASLIWTVIARNRNYWRSKLVERFMAVEILVATVGLGLYLVATW